jgi:hypothetical protein
VSVLHVDSSSLLTEALSSAFVGYSVKAVHPVLTAAPGEGRGARTLTVPGRALRSQKAK